MTPSSRDHTPPPTNFEDAHRELRAGELGHGDARPRVAPKKVECGHQFLKVAAGDAHTLGIVLRHVAVGREARERRPPGAPNAHVGPKRRPCACVSKLRYACPRASPTSLAFPAEGSPRAAAAETAPLYCKTCDCLSLCPWCARMCHAGHDVAPVDPATLKNVPPRSRGGPGSGAAAPDVSDDAPGAAAYPTLCECGFRNSCKRLSTLSEFLENASVEPAAATLHRFARRIIAKGHTRQLRTALAFCRHFAARTAWTGPTLAGAVSARAGNVVVFILGAPRGAVLHDLVDIISATFESRAQVWKRARDFVEAKASSLERPRMAAADAEGVAARRYIKLQAISRAGGTLDRSIRRSGRHPTPRLRRGYSVAATPRL